MYADVLENAHVVILCECNDVSAIDVDDDIYTVKELRFAINCSLSGDNAMVIKDIAFDGKGNCKNMTDIELKNLICSSFIGKFSEPDSSYRGVYDGMTLTYDDCR